MTLEILLRKFEKARAKIAGSPGDHGYGFTPDQTIDFFEGAGSWIFNPSPLVTPIGNRIHEIIELNLKMYWSAKLYVVARDDGLSTAMLWKLSQP